MLNPYHPLYTSSRTKLPILPNTMRLPNTTRLQECAKHFLQLVLGVVFCYSVVVSLIKWEKGKTGMTHEIRSQPKRFFPSVKICRALATSGSLSKNLTEIFLHIPPIKQHVLHLEHKVEMENG